MRIKGLLANPVHTRNGCYNVTIKIKNKHYLSDIVEVIIPVGSMYFRKLESSFIVTKQTDFL